MPQTILKYVPLYHRNSTPGKEPAALQRHIRGVPPRPQFISPIPFRKVHQGLPVLFPFTHRRPPVPARQHVRGCLYKSQKHPRCSPRRGMPSMQPKSHKQQHTPEIEPSHGPQHRCAAFLTGGEAEADFHAVRHDSITRLLGRCGTWPQKDDTVEVPRCTRARRGVVRQRRTSDPAPAEFCVLVS
jgi:hypothetical protein